MKRKFYLAYGSNMNAEQMKHRCPKATFVKTVVVKNFDFLINSQGVATLVREEGKSVEGVVWHLTEECEASLDIYEGIATGDYVKENIVLSEYEEALIYFATDSSPGRPNIDYAERITKGAEGFNLSEEYMHYLKIKTYLK